MIREEIHFEWDVLDGGYEWREEESGNIFLAPASTDAIPAATARVCDAPTLFAEFADLRPDPAAYLSWANEHGPLVPLEGDSIYHYTRRRRNTLLFWNREHEDLALATAVYESLRNEDSPRWHRWHGLPASLLDLEAKGALSQWLNNEISRKTRQFPVQALPQPESRPIHFYLQPTSQIALLWYQLTVVFLGDIHIRRCAICGKWENMEGHRSTWTKHANCANYQRVKRARKKKASGNPPMGHPLLS